MPNHTSPLHHHAIGRQQLDRLNLSHQGLAVDVMVAAKNHIPTALLIVQLLEAPASRVNVKLAAKIASLPGLLEELRQATGAEATALVQQIQQILSTFSRRPKYNGAQWLRAFNGSPHLQPGVDEHGNEYIELLKKHMHPAVQNSFQHLERTVGKKNLPALINAYFFGHSGAHRGYFSIIAAWRRIKKKEPLPLELLAWLSHVILNPLSPEATTHDLQHIAGANHLLYGTSAASEGVGSGAGGGDFDRNGHYFDQLAKNKNDQLHKQPAFSHIVTSRVTRFLVMGSDFSPLMDPSSLLSTAVLNQLDLSAVAPWSVPSQMARLILAEVNRKGGRAHLNESEEKQIQQLLTDSNNPASIASLIATHAFAGIDALKENIKPTLHKLDRIQRQAAARLLPEQESDRLDFVAQLITLELILARGGYLHSQRSLSRVDTDTLWSQVSKDFRRLKTIDFATEFPKTYEEVKEQIDLYMKSSIYRQVEKNFINLAQQALQ